MNVDYSCYEGLTVWGLPEVVMQRGRILVENALRHTPPGTRVDVSASAEDGLAVLTVRDEGPGVPDTEREHIFQRFYRAGGGKASGSGLGLAIARTAALRNGLRIALRNRSDDERGGTGLVARVYLSG